MLQNTPRRDTAFPSPHTPSSELPVGNRPASDYRIVEPLIAEYSPKLSGPDRDFVATRIFSHLSVLRSHTPSLENLRGKQILDVACGSRLYTENNRGSHDPWMPRLLLALGAIPFGIDAEDQVNERFDFRKADLLIRDSLGFLASASFDSYHIRAFPTKKTATTIGECGLSWPAIRDNILSHLSRALKPGCKPICTFDEATDKYVRENAPARMPHQWRIEMLDDDF